MELKYERIIIVILILIIIALGLFNHYIYQQMISTSLGKNEVPQVHQQEQISITQTGSSPDLVNVYDYRVLDDPMKDPKRRPPRHILGPLAGTPYFNIDYNFPTRGWRDNFSQQGYLVDQKASTDDPNKILLLFGREKWPRSNQYEYYVVFQSGDKERKYDLDNYRKELYNGDEVVIDILNNRKYTVKLFKQEGLEYNPFIF